MWKKILLVLLGLLILLLIGFLGELENK